MAQMDEAKFKNELTPETLELLHGFEVDDGVMTYK